MLGDTAQLPPVGECWSPALQPDVLTGMGLWVTCKTLTQVVRQADESLILSNATNLRRAIATDTTDTWPDIRFGSDVENVPGNELVERISHCYREYGMDNVIVVARSNKRANIYNNGIRSQILDRESELSAGDMVMIAKNNYYWLGRSLTLGIKLNL